MKVSESLSPDLRYVAAIVAFVFAVHGLLLINDGIYWDDWLWIDPATSGLELDRILAAGAEMGIMATSRLHVWIAGLFGYRTVTFVSLLAAGVLVFYLGRHKEMLRRGDALAAALITISYPAYQTWVVFSTGNYVFYYAAFLLGALIAVKAELFQGTRRALMTAAALILFFLSYNLNSLLVFYFGFLLLLFYLAYKGGTLPLKRSLLYYFPRRLHFVLLPFVYWILKEAFFPRYGPYTNYNQFTFSPALIHQSLVCFWTNGIKLQFKASLFGLFRHPVLWLFTLFGVWLWYARSKSEKPELTGTPNAAVSPRALLAYGFLLLGLGIFPYIAVGLCPSLAGWPTRHSLLLSLPVALLLAASARLLFKSPGGGFSRAGWMHLASLLLAFGIVTVSGYIDWQARWVKDRSIMVNLARLPGAGDHSVYWVDHQYYWGGETDYRFYEWSSIFKKVWGGETRIGFDKRSPDPKMLEEVKTLFNASYNLGSFDPAGPQALLAVRRGVEAGPVLFVVWRYYSHKFLRPQNMEAFLAGITDVRVQPVKKLI